MFPGVIIRETLAVKNLDTPAAHAFFCLHNFSRIDRFQQVDTEDIKYMSETNSTMQQIKTHSITVKMPFMKEFQHKTMLKLFHTFMVTA